MGGAVAGVAGMTMTLKLLLVKYPSYCRISSGRSATGGQAVMLVRPARAKRLLLTGTDPASRQDMHRQTCHKDCG